MMTSILDPKRQNTQSNASRSSSSMSGHDTTHPDTDPYNSTGQVLDRKNDNSIPNSESSHNFPQRTPNGTTTSDKVTEASTPSKSLSLSIDTPTSSSAFPSPSSSFIPPPTFDEEEFAIQPAPRKKSQLTDTKVPTPIVLPPPEAVNEPNSSSSKLEVYTNDTRTPRLSTSNLQPSPMAPVFSLPASTRPAPQSPVASRRTSRAISIHSSPSNSTSSPGLKPQNTGRDSFQARPARMSSLSVSMLPAGAKVTIKIIDFAFDAEDKRRLGFGEHVPKCNRPARMNRRLTLPDQTTGAETETETEEEEEEEAESDGWGGFSWGRLSYSFPSSTATVRDEPGPSRGQLDANFGQDSDDEEYHSAEEDTHGDETYEDDSGPLYPGLYRALYAFEPEGTSEMRLEPDQLVTVLGRGGGDGWAIALREEDGQHALVPEGYLELVRLDGEDEDD